MFCERSVNDSLSQSQNLQQLYPINNIVEEDLDKSICNGKDII